MKKRSFMKPCLRTSTYDVPSRTRRSTESTSSLAAPREASRLARAKTMARALEASLVAAACACTSMC